MELTRPTHYLRTNRTAIIKHISTFSSQAERGLQQWLCQSVSPLKRGRACTHILGHLDEGEGILCGLCWQHTGAEGRWQGTQAGRW